MSRSSEQVGEGGVSNRCTSGEASPAAPVAYLTTSYPSVSHSFIRREILGLEALGVPVLRLAIRQSEHIVDPADQAENEKTLHFLQLPRQKLTAHVLRGLARVRLRLIAGLAASWKLHRASERGVLRHLAYLLEALVLVDVCARAGASHVHVHFGTNAAAVALLARLMGGPSYSMTIHGPDELDAPIGLSLGWKMRCAAFTVAISTYCASQLMRWVPYDEWAKIHVVRCSVEPHWFDGGSPVADDASDLVCVGRLSAQKGQMLLLDAFAAAREQGLQGRLVLVGDGELRGALETRIQALGLSDQVLITGWADAAAVRAWLERARLFVLPSFAEGLPVVIMEALAMQRPVLTTSIAGIPELMEDGVTGWLVPAGDRRRLRDALVAAWETPPEMLGKMGRQGSQRVLLHHSQAALCGEMHRLLCEYGGVSSVHAREITCSHSC